MTRHIYRFGILVLFVLFSSFFSVVAQEGNTTLTLSPRETGQGGIKIETVRPGQAPIASPKSGEGKSQLNTSPSDGSKTDINNDPAAVYDPVAVNGEFFKDWDKPELALVFTGPLDGYIEPCGCAGMEQMKGGLSRRYTFLKELRDQGWPVVAIDSGGMVEKFGRQQEMKFQMATTALQQMKYDAIGLGKNDLRLPADELLTVTVTSSSQNPSVFVSANMGVIAFDPQCTNPYRVIERNGYRIGVTSIVGTSWQSQISNSEIVMADPVKKLKEILPAMIKQKAQYMVLICHASVEETQKIAKAFPEFGIIFSVDSPSEPPLAPQVNTKDGRVQYTIETGEKGKFAVVLGFFKDEKMQVRYQRVALDSRFKNAPNIISDMAIYQKNLKRDLDTAGFAALGIRPVAAPEAAALGNYVGTEKCKACHEESYRVWKKSKHAEAWRSLETISKPPRTYDPECICCHVVGWNPQEMHPYVSGFSNELGKITTHLTNVGCESCHGPGEKHCQAEMGGNTQLQEELQAGVRVSLDTSKKLCYTCHDLDNSPHFDFETYWPKIEHKELIDPDSP